MRFDERIIILYEKRAYAFLKSSVYQALNVRK